MNETMIRNHNSVVGPEDTIYHIGDVAFMRQEDTEKVLARLNGIKYLIKGNHDGKINNLHKYFKWVKDYHELTIPDESVGSRGQFIILTHYSFRVWNRSHHGSWNLYGHSHGTLYDDPNLLSMDVGVDPNKFFPISYEQVKAHMKKKTFKPIDHHGKKEDKDN